MCVWIKIDVEHRATELSSELSSEHSSAQGYQQ